MKTKQKAKARGSQKKPSDVPSVMPHITMLPHPSYLPYLRLPILFIFLETTTEKYTQLIFK